MSTIYDRIPASPEEVEQYAGSIPPEYLYCRVWHHSPEPHNVVLTKGTGKHKTAFYSASLRCRNGCGVVWAVLVDRDGKVLKRSLDYHDAPGYVLDGKGRIDKNGNQILRKTFFVSKTTKSRRGRK
jgi:hypothetical protein